VKHALDRGQWNEANGEVLPLILLAICTFIFLLLNQSDRQEESTDTNNTLQSILRTVDGVGDVRVYLHYENNKGTGNFFDNYFEPNTSSQTVTGVLVVAEGAKDERVKRLLIETIANVLQVSSHRIVVVPMNLKEE
jgi:stage III sporulation protein AG